MRTDGGRLNAVRGHGRAAGTLRQRLERLERPLRVTMTGAGAMGKGLFYQMHVTPGIECVALADLHLERAVACAEYVGRPYRVVRTVEEVHAAIKAGAVAVCEDGDLVARCELADVFVESTSAIAEGAEFCQAALESQMHLVMMNAEVDLIHGPLLMREAHQRGLVYTSCDGDQHGVIRRLVDEAALWGFELVMAGNVKGFLDRYANPTSIVPEADKRNLDYHMCTAYTDGTKLSIEMALVANALDLRTDGVGMHGPRAGHVNEVLDLFDLGALRAGGPVVDYVLGAEPGGGVFVVGYGDDPYQRDMMRYYKMGEGPYYVFYRPYHLCHVEAMRCIAEAALDGYSLLEPTHGIRTNVVAYAKRDLRAGEVLDGIGGYACYGQIENVDEAVLEGLPICLAHDVPLLRDVRMDERIGIADVDLPRERADVRLFEYARRAGVATNRHAVPTTTPD